MKKIMGIVDGFLALGFAFFIIVTGSILAPIVDEQSSLIGTLYAFSIIASGIYVLVKGLSEEKKMKND